MSRGYDRQLEEDYKRTPYRLWVKPTLIILIAAIVFLFVRSAYSVEVQTGVKGKTSDGDTLWICNDNACTKYRLCGVDSPERGEAGYKEASEALTAITKGKTIRCVPVNDGTVCDGRSRRTSGNRIVAQCFIGELDIAAEMIRQKHACDWPKYSGGYYGKIQGACVR